VVISIFKSRVGKGAVSVSIDRGKESVAIFYGAYISISGLLAAICLSVEFIKDYRIIWVIIDILIAAYICIVSPWFRNKLIGFSMKIKKLES
jgi:type III secretory pathway component EscS